MAERSADTAFRDERTNETIQTRVRAGSDLPNDAPISPTRYGVRWQSAAPTPLSAMNEPTKPSNPATAPDNVVRRVVKEEQNEMKPSNPPTAPANPAASDAPVTHKAASPLRSAAALHKTPWPHAPVHRLSEGGVYFVTAATYLKAHHFRRRERVQVLHRGLLKVAAEFGWQLEAWAVFSNHYHFVGHSPVESAGGLRVMLGKLHEKTAKWLNRLDNTPARKVWHNYWDTRLTYTRSYFARLNYTHHNAVKHGLVAVASQYPWCSAAWFERTASAAQVKTIYSLKTDQLNVADDYEASNDW